ncbi:hypothetical protein CGSMWGv1500E_01648 [Gardnerella vaginalis 1500E]|uniref:Uncharacterized protein n=1 Tax=Gardnerella vaginalis 1500E TaxID=698957 RepID=I4M2Z1_GARVA|nr:hypothetical protein CGSMWGv1500E_01648 [Gardnerella vaginalis 1500E]
MKKDAKWGKYLFIYCLAKQQALQALHALQALQPLA